MCSGEVWLQLFSVRSYWHLLATVAVCRESRAVMLGRMTRHLGHLGRGVNAELVASQCGKSTRHLGRFARGAL